MRVRLMRRSCFLFIFLSRCASMAWKVEDLSSLALRRRCFSSRRARVAACSARRSSRSRDSIERAAATRALTCARISNGREACDGGAAAAAAGAEEAADKGPAAAAAAAVAADVAVAAADADGGSAAASAEPEEGPRAAGLGLDATEVRERCGTFQVRPLLGAPRVGGSSAAARPSAKPATTGAAGAAAEEEEDVETAAEAAEASDDDIRCAKGERQSRGGSLAQK
jgi:hypothetical protein